MTGNEEFYRLTFSQREGKAPLPEPMRLEHVSTDFRNLIWLAVDNAIEQEMDIDEILSDYTFKVLHWPHDRIGHRFQDTLRKIILKKNYDFVLTLIEFILRHNLCPQQLQNDLEDAFRKAPLAYSVQTINDLPTIVPHSIEESGAVTEQAIETIEQEGPAGAKTHLHDAAKAINEKRYADAVRESIHAVESVARTIAPDAGNTLGPALTSLEKAGVLNHGALKSAFSTLYGYTSDEKGIRHALLEEEAADVDLDDAYSCSEPARPSLPI